MGTGFSTVADTPSIDMVCASGAATSGAGAVAGEVGASGATGGTVQDARAHIDHSPRDHHHRAGGAAAAYKSRLILPPPSPLTVADVYNVGECIGRGGFATVHRATHRESGERVALKFMIIEGAVGCRHVLTQAQIHEEIRVMAFLARDRKPSHKNERTVMHTPRLLEWFVSPPRGSCSLKAPAPSRVIIATTLAEGGSLFDIVIGDTGVSYKAVTRRMNLARRVLKAVCKELALLHSADLVHNDVKLENVLVKEHVDPHDGDAIPASMLTTTFLLSDVGLVRDLERQRQGFSPLHGNDRGTEAMRAPELKEASGIPLKDRNPTCATDMYAAGLLAFSILTHLESPNFGNTSWAWTMLPEPAKDLLKGLLAVNPAERPSAAETLEIIWKHWSRADHAVANAEAEGMLRRPRVEAPLTLRRTPTHLRHHKDHHRHHHALASHAKGSVLINFSRKSVSDYEKLAVTFKRHHPHGLVNKMALRDTLLQELHLNTETVDALLNNDRLYDLVDSDHSGHIDWRELCTLLPLAPVLVGSDSAPSLASLPEETLRLICLVWDRDGDGCLDSDDLERMKTVLHIVATDACPTFNAAIRQLSQSKNQREHAATCFRQGNGPLKPFKDPVTGLFSPCANCCYYYRDRTDVNSAVLLRDVLDYDTLLAAMRSGAVEA